MTERRRHLANRDFGCGRDARAGVRIAVSLLCVAVFAASGCTTLAPQPPRGPQAAYTVGAPDKLGIDILPDPSLKLSATVRPDGKISVPLIGDVQATGRTIPQIAADIEEKMAKFKRGAQVTVSLENAVHTDITVLGEVGSPSAFPLVKDTRIVEAIASVGGPTTFAWTSRIRVIRSPADVTEIHRVNLNAIRKGDLSTNLLLEPGDIVYVPPTILARIGYAINAVLFPFQPVLGLARTGVSGIIP